MSSDQMLDASKMAFVVVVVVQQNTVPVQRILKYARLPPKYIVSLIQNCRERNTKRIIWVRADYNITNAHHDCINFHGYMKRGCIS